MVKSGENLGRPHEHCDRCYSTQCQIAAETFVSCVVIKCHKNCGATLHACKKEEHQLLCPNEMVPCLNAGYGCPFTMLRHRVAKHLEVCPASIVSCTQEWNRWPVSDTDMAFYRNVSTDLECDDQVDLAMAMRDQDLLFRSIKMKNVFPELMEVLEEPCLEDMAVGWNSSGCETTSPFGCRDSEEMCCASMPDRELNQDEREALAKCKDLESIQNYSSWEGMFRKEMQGCKQTAKNLAEKEEPSTVKDEKESSNGQMDSKDSNGIQSDGATGNMNGPTGLAPWQDGVLERLSKEANIAEYNMYLVHNGAMLINFGQLSACTPREKDFVYGNLEPIEVQTIRSFNVPLTYRPKRCHLKDPSRKVKMVHQSVDTKDLGIPVENLPKSDEVSATLLSCLEKELKGHLISESAGTDGFFVDIGTQTYDFSSAPFKMDTSLADVIANKPKRLYVQIQAESVTRRHNKTSTAFNFCCGQFFRRDEYHFHFRNIHSDIQPGVNGWFEQRCPLAFLGCTFSQTRFRPATHQAKVKYYKNLNTFALQPVVTSAPTEDEKTLNLDCTQKCTQNGDLLSRLPFEILQHIAGFLDGCTLFQLSQVSRIMREVCATLLQERGMVSLKWEKKVYSHGGASWKCQKKKWEFSCLFSSVDRWCFNNIPSMSEHLKVCSFYQREEHSEPVALVSMSEVADRGESQNC